MLSATCRLIVKRQSFLHPTMLAGLPLIRYQCRIATKGVAMDAPRYRLGEHVTVFFASENTENYLYPSQDRGRLKSSLKLSRSGSG